MKAIKSVVLTSDGSKAYESSAAYRTAGDRYATFLSAREDARRHSSDKRRKEYRNAFTLMNNNRPVNVYDVVQVPSICGGFVLTTLDCPHCKAAACPIPIY